MAFFAALPVPVCHGCGRKHGSKELGWIYDHVSGPLRGSLIESTGEVLVMHDQGTENRHWCPPCRRAVGIVLDPMGWLMQWGFEVTCRPSRVNEGLVVVTARKLPHDDLPVPDWRQRIDEIAPLTKSRDEDDEDDEPEHLGTWSVEAGSVDAGCWELVMLAKPSWIAEIPRGEFLLEPLDRRVSL